MEHYDPLGNKKGLSVNKGYGILKNMKHVKVNKGQNKIGLKYPEINNSNTNFLATKQSINTLSGAQNTKGQSNYFWDDKYKSNVSTINETRLNFNIINHSSVKPKNDSPNFRRSHNISGVVDRLHSFNYNDDY